MSFSVKKSKFSIFQYTHDGKPQVSGLAPLDKPEKMKMHEKVAALYTQALKVIGILEILRKKKFWIENFQEFPKKNTYFTWICCE